jgi:hypothetical protein
MYLLEMLYLQDLVDEKLHKELHLRNLIAHVALSRRLHEMQMEYDMEDCVPAGKKSESSQSSSLVLTLGRTHLALRPRCPAFVSSMGQ